ncbi:hypothetical protein ABIB35_003167 [Arthrobacter sp. UYP6]
MQGTGPVDNRVAGARGAATSRETLTPDLINVGTRGHRPQAVRRLGSANLDMVCVTC